MVSVTGLLLSSSVLSQLERETAHRASASVSIRDKIFFIFIEFIETVPPNRFVDGFAAVAEVFSKKRRIQGVNLYFYLYFCRKNSNFFAFYLYFCAKGSVTNRKNA